MNRELSADTILSHYRIISKIGEGGMGEVYLAHDTRLDRKVALKVLPADVASHHNRMERFIREAKAAAALNHPHIAQIHEIGEHDGIHFIVMEFIQGVTLREKIHREQTELTKLLRYLQQAAEGLSKAHGAGVVHRDLKPDNIMITSDGFAKVLDFGLAKLVENRGPGFAPSEGSNAPTEMMQQQSVPGTVMGTVGYMSPEQAQGRTDEIDQRSDVFSFGCILFEAVTRHRAFEGKDAIDSLNKIIREPVPPINDFRADLPAHLQRIVRRCLAKDREDRYQTIKDVAIELRELRRELEGSGIDTTVKPVRTETTTESSAATKSAEAPSRSVAGSTVTQASSAEYIVTGIKQHKLAVVIVVGVLLIGAIGFVVYTKTRNSASTIESIAVLPFENRSNDPDADYISDGLTESINNSLTHLPNLKVIPHSVAFHYKGKPMDAQKFGDELRVNAVLIGRVVQRGDNLTISVELDDVRNGKQLWGEQYDRKVADLLAVKSDIAREVSQRLRSQLSGEEQQKLKRGSTENPEAYQLYLKGNYYTSKFTKDGFRKGVDYFNQAIAADPNYGLAYAGLAFNYFNSEDWFIPPREAGPKAKDAARKALAIDPTLSDAHLALAVIAQWYEYDWVTAEREFKQAIELSPSDPRPHDFYSWFLAPMGRHEEALAEAKRGQQLNPVSPEANIFVGSVLVFARQYDQAIPQLKSAIELDKSYWFGYYFLGRAYEQKGRIPEAIEVFQRALDLEKDNAENWANLGHAYAISGKRAEALKIIDHLNELSATSYVAPYNIAAIHAGLGNKDEAFAALDRAYNERSALLAIYLTNDPRMDSLRSDPRFNELGRRIGLPQ
ncbi:MAG TPA: protein kinase [Pyrinomonadaceae bacterium]|nr:protein kinase [Pyrinomonadaceae bacterium]